MKNEIFLPGMEGQIDFVKEHINFKGLDVLVVGTFSEPLALEFAELTGKQVQLIVPDFDSLINSNLLLEGKQHVKVRIMDYERTDFDDSSFDLVFAQASISTDNRRKILKEIKRVLKPDGYFCVGEIVTNEIELPVFVRDDFYNSGLYPIYDNDLISFYKGVGFDYVVSEDFPKALKEYYTICKERLSKTKGMLNDQEQSYYKKILKRINHESNMFIKFSADKIVSFRTLLFKRG